MTLNKKTLIAAVADDASVKKQTVEDVINSVLKVVIHALANGELVEIANFGKFESFQRDARTARNPISGESIDVPAKKAVRFKPSKALKDALNK